MRCERPVGHADAIEGLWRAARARRLPHALLFAGPDGVGKFLAAQWLAFGLLCASREGERPGPPCGTCGACKRLATDAHPDVFVLDPLALDLETIKINYIVPRPKDHVPNVSESLSLRPMEGGWRIVIVREAERMNAAAQNALLKTLEEPGAQALLVLVTSFPGSLLPTVRSRCSAVGFDALPLERTRELLVREGRDEETAARLAAWSGGAPGRALTLAARGAERLVATLARTLAGELDPLEAAAAIAEHEGDFGGGTPRQAARERARTAVDLALGLLADAQRAAAGAAPEGLAFGDVAPRLDPRAVQGRLEAALRARQDVEANLAPDAVLEQLLLELAPAAAARP